jgi:hypothetical protein
MLNINIVPLMRWLLTICGYRHYYPLLIVTSRYMVFKNIIQSFSTIFKPTFFNNFK